MTGGFGGGVGGGRENATQKKGEDVFPTCGDADI